MSTDTNNKDTSANKDNYFTRALEQAKHARDEITAREDAYRRVVISPQDEITLSKCFTASMIGFCTYIYVY
jgi:hypothetical protein